MGTQFFGLTRSEDAALSLGVVLAEHDMDFRDALCSEIEGFNFLWGHANENFGLASIGLLFGEGGQFVAQFFELLRIEPTLWIGHYP